MTLLNYLGKNLGKHMKTLVWGTIFFYNLPKAKEIKKIDIHRKGNDHQRNNTNNRKKIADWKL